MCGLARTLTKDWEQANTFSLAASYKFPWEVTRGATGEMITEVA